MSEWIQLKDKHPGSVLVVAYDANSYYSPTIAHWECGHGFIPVDGVRRTWNITHWLPLPPIPTLI